MKQNCAFKVSYNETQQKMYVEWEKIDLPSNEIPKVTVGDNLADKYQNQFIDKPMLYDVESNMFKGLNIEENLL